MEESWIIINDNPIAGPYDRTAEEKLRILYSCYLLSKITKCLPSAKELDSVKMLKSKYADRGPPDLRMSEDELNYRKAIM